MGNLRSVSKALEHAGRGVKVRVTYDPESILRADRVVFPGVGALRGCMDELQRLGLDEVIREVVTKKPLLGICLGMQALFARSAENRGTLGLGILGGEVRGFIETLAPSARLKIPHMGWNQVHQARAHPLWEGIAQDSRFYFVHSYYVAPTQPDCVAGVTEYGHEFVCAVACENLFAVQFHPEKSQHAGLTLLSNFVRWDGQG